MCDHQRLHRHRILFHQIADARVGIDHYFIGQTHLAAPVVPVGGNELLAIAPVAVVDWHADRGIGVHHLFSGDDLELVGICVEAEAPSGAADGLVILMEQLEGPVAWRRQFRRRRLGRQRPVA